MKAFIVVVLISFTDLSYQADWSYDYQTQWPGVCRSGNMQSPINIMTRDAVFDPHEAHIRGPLVFRGYKDVAVTARNNGHTLKWSGFPGNPAPVLSGGPLRGNYTFLQFHLHWLSEHAIDGMKYPLEIHMVHIKTGLTIAEALARPDGLSVLGVLCQVTSGGNSEQALEEIIPKVPNLINQSDDESDSFNIDVTRLFSPEPQSYYTYHGSLTTPMCQEVVTWIVMDKPLFISDTQYRKFGKINIGGLENYRSLQPTNRMVYRSMSSCSSIMVPSLLGTFAGLFSCLSSTLSSGVSKGICIIGNIKRRIFGDVVKQCSKGERHGIALAGTATPPRQARSATTRPSAHLQSERSERRAVSGAHGTRRCTPRNVLRTCLAQAKFNQRCSITPIPNMNSPITVPRHDYPLAEDLSFAIEEHSHLVPP